MICIPQRRCCSLDAVYSTKSCHATGLQNPRTHFLVIGRIVHFDFHPSSRHGNRGRVLGTLGGRRGQLHFPRGGDERLRTVLLANSSPLGLAGASIMAATYRLSRAEMFSMPMAESSPFGVVGAPLVASPLQTPLFVAALVHPSWLHRRLVAPCLLQTPPFTIAFLHPLWLQKLFGAPCLLQTPPFTV